MKLVGPSVHGEAHASGFEKHNLDALIAVKVETPVLGTAAVLDSDARQTRQDV